jgi:hypothetical protein
MPASASARTTQVRTAALRVIDLVNRTMSLQPLFGEDALQREGPDWLRRRARRPEPLFG